MQCHPRTGAEEHRWELQRWVASPIPPRGPGSTLPGEHPRPPKGCREHLAGAVGRASLVTSLIPQGVGSTWAAPWGTSRRWRAPVQCSAG